MCSNLKKPAIYTANIFSDTVFMVLCITIKTCEEHDHPNVNMWIGEQTNRCIYQVCGYNMYSGKVKDSENNCYTMFLWLNQFLSALYSLIF